MHKKNGLIKAVLLPLICAGMLIAAVACGDDSCPDGSHTWGEWSTTATCTEAGQETRTCTQCGETETREAAALGHSWGDYTVTDAAACETGGTEERECSRCHTKDSRPIEKLGHVLVKTDAVPSTCTEKGNIEYYTCSRCLTKFTDAQGKNKTEDVSSDLAPHKMTLFVEAATGHQKQCSVCGTISDEILSHTYGTAFDATHSDSLHHWHVCTACGAKQEASDALHTYVDGICTACNRTQEAYSEGLTYELEGETYVVSGTTGSAPADIVIPAYYDGKLVTAIGESAFESNTSITSVVIPDSVTEVRLWAFFGCRNLASVTIGKGVTSFGRAVFTDTNISNVKYMGTAEDWCRITFESDSSHPFYASPAGSRILYLADGSPLERVTIPEDITEVGKYTFYQCESLKSVTFGKQVQSIGESAFYNCTALDTALFEDESITSIGATAFYGCALQSVLLPAGLTTLGQEAFHACTSLAHLELPSSLGTIPDSAFMGCTALLTVEGNGGFTSIGSNAFSGCELLVSVTGCNAVTTIGESAFKDCEKLSQFTLSQTLTSIGSSAFNGCKALLSATIPASCTKIGEYAFSGSGLTSVTIEGGNTPLTIGTQYYGYSFMYTAISQIDIPDRVTLLGPNTFYGCTNLATVNIGTGLASIGESAFYGCTALTSFTVSPANEHIAFETGCLIDKTTHSVQLGIGTVTIPTSAELVTAIGKGAFKNNTEIKGALTIPANITSIGEQAFSACTELTSVTLPASVMNIPNNLFDGCSKLQSVTFGDQTATIGTAAFKGCTQLGTVALPATVTSIGASAFSGCENLVTTLGDNVTYVGQFAFQGCVKSFTQEEGSELQYIGKWVVGIADKTLTAITAEMFKSGTVGIGGGAFNAMDGLLSLVLPEGVKYLCDEAVSECSLLSSVTLPSTLKLIGTRAFYNCTALQEIVIPASVDEIGMGALACAYGSALKTVTLQGEGTWKRYAYYVGTGAASTGTVFANASSPTATATAMKSSYPLYVWRREKA